MDSEHICPICQKYFSRNDNLKRHISCVHDPVRENKRKFQCSICQKFFTRKYDMKRHIDNVHQRQLTDFQALITKIDQLEENNEKLKLELIHSNEKLKNELIENNERLDHRIGDLQNKPTNITQNQILNVICVSNNDNYLDMLTARLNDFHQAIDYIKDCALSDLSGDCKLIEKIYNNSDGQLGFSIDRKKTTIFYHNENNQSCSESKDVFSRKIANNLQNSYLKGINHLINQNLDLRKDPNQFLADYDMLTWNSHIYQLSDIMHQKKIMSQLHIPTK